jgi:hypothetical protein
MPHDVIGENVSERSIVALGSCPVFLSQESLVRMHPSAHLVADLRVECMMTPWLTSMS